MKELRIRVHFIEEILGTASANPELHREYIASKAEDAASIEEEIAAIGVTAEVEKAMTVFPRDAEDNPIFWDYQWKGFFKDTCSALKRVDGTKSKSMKAYKKIIDGLVFPSPRMIPIKFDGEMGDCQRPLRASTPQGERIALANSEAIPAGAECELSILLFDDSLVDAVIEWLDFGKYRGMGQWRNSGKGRFEYEIIEII